MIERHEADSKMTTTWCSFFNCWNEFTDFTSDFLLLEDCILLGPNSAPVAGPEDSRLWVYAIFGNTPVLIEHSQYEVRLGVAAAVRRKDLLFMVDTEGQYPVDYLSQYASKVAPDELARIFTKNKTTPKEVSLHNPSPAGPSVKSSTIHADDLAETPAQLSDAVLVCSTVLLYSAVACFITRMPGSAPFHNLRKSW